MFSGGSRPTTFSQPRRSKLSRRELLGATFASSALAGVGGEGLVARAASAHADDAAVLSSLIGVELAIVFAYERILASGELSGAATQLADEALAQERAHVTRLTAELHARGQTPPAGPSSVAEADKELDAHHFSGSLLQLTSQGYCLRRLYDVEAIAVGAYYEALPKLSDPVLLRTAAEIMGVEAQHAAAFGGLMHPGNIKRIVPLGFVAGKH